MRLDAITVGHVRRAVDLYLEEAYRGASRPPAPVLEGPDEAPIAGQLACFEDEAARSGAAARCYALRLGNPRYRFMKLLLTEYLVRDHFFFVVDTHDQMFHDPHDPELKQLRDYNRNLKARVEAAWDGARLPTLVHMRGLVSEQPIAPEPKKGRRILLVDDDQAIQETVALLLRAKGYDVDQAYDGDEALERVDPERHDLVLMDVEMPRQNGDEACRRLKADPRTRHLPVLLASAGAVELAREASPDGYLVKPFQPEALFRFLDVLLRRRPSS